MIDIHTHILPNVDDGASSPSETLKMLEKMERDGVTYVVATPHCNVGTPLFRDEIVPRVEDLNRVLATLNAKIRVLPGSEISLFSSEYFRANYENGNYCHLGDKTLYSLIEFPWHNSDVPKDALETIVWLKEQGTTPVIAHPERTPFLRENPRFIQDLVKHGAILQVTVDSLCGLTSTNAKTVAEMLLRNFEPIVLASDSHNLARCSGLSMGYQKVAQKFGMARAKMMLAYSNAMLQNILDAQTPVSSTRYPPQISL